MQNFVYSVIDPFRRASKDWLDYWVNSMSFYIKQKKKKKFICNIFLNDKISHSEKLKYIFRM